MAIFRWFVVPDYDGQLRFEIRRVQSMGNKAARAECPQQSIELCGFLRAGREDIDLMSLTEGLVR